MIFISWVSLEQSVSVVNEKLQLGRETGVKFVHFHNVVSDGQSVAVDPQASPPFARKCIGVIGPSAGSIMGRMDTIDLNSPKTLEEVGKLVACKIPESIHLEYKASPALSKQNRDEIAKDVSSFANSDGGVLVYGVTEKDNIPVCVDQGVEDAACDREWLEQTIMSAIRPRLSDLGILMIPREPGRSIVVVTVGKSFRGPHQASDKKYYRRQNFTSVPMEDYEVNELRQRRKLLPPLLTFDLVAHRGFVAAFDFANVGDVAAEDVTIEFSPEIPWPSEKGKPPLFERGVKRFSPRQHFRFRWFAFNEVLGENSKIPSQFSVRLDYYHPDAGTRISDEWHLDFEAYRESMGVKSDVELMGNDIVKALKDINDGVKKLNGLLQNFGPIAGSTGLDLSIPTIRNLRRTLKEGLDVEKLRSECCQPEVFAEVLGVDYKLGYEIYKIIGPQPSTGTLRDIPGMTEDLFTKILESFVIGHDREPC